MTKIKMCFKVLEYVEYKSNNCSWSNILLNLIHSNTDNFIIYFKKYIKGHIKPEAS